MLKIDKISTMDEIFNLLKSLYERSFPENERVDLEKLLDISNISENGIDILAIFDGSVFIGFVIKLDVDDISHILYFAVNDSLRNKGYGSKIIQSIHNKYPHKRFMVDVEKPDSKCTNNEQREKRINFYSKNGYTLTKIKYKWHKEIYLVMSFGGDISKEEHKEFWKQRSSILNKFK